MTAYELRMSDWSSVVCSSDLAAAGRLHTARSRNDQVATDFKLWTRAAIDEVLSGLGTLQDALIARAEEHADSVMPGFTHLQSAQPVTLGHHLMAYHAMIARDRSRFADARARANECPLGAAALEIGRAHVRTPVTNA